MTETQTSAEQVRALYEMLGVTEHPILALPDADQVMDACATEEGKAELIEMLRRRQKRIVLAQMDPLSWTFEPETWKDADAILNGGWVERGGECEVLALFGGNRAQKTFYAMMRICQLAHWYPNCLLLAGSESETQSIETVQRYVWLFLHPYYGHLSGKRDAARAAGQEGNKFNYTRAEGFTNRRIALPNGSVMHFPTYNQDCGVYEGWEFGCPREDYRRVSKERVAKGLFVPPNVGAVMDESMGLKWLQMLSRRLPFRKAKGLWPFTPVKGITPAIKEMVGASAVTLESRPSELLPRRNLPDVPEGHMPYVRKCAMPKSYAIYFFTQYTKWGNYYEEIKARCQDKDSQYIERVAYGFARDSVNRAFKKFGAWNIIKREHLPMKGTNYLFIDPAGARNWFMLWVRVAPPRWADGKWTHYIYRDWPDAQTYGEWAVATEREVSDDQRKGWDGDAGPAQAGQGYGVRKYKETILEWERIKCPPPSYEIFKTWEKEADPYHVGLVKRALARNEPLEQLREKIEQRLIDPRAGKQEHLAEAGGTCIIDEFAEVQVDGNNTVVGPSMELFPASGVIIDEGIGLVNDLLDWNQEQPLVSVMNQPHLFVCEDCYQVRWMFENYTGRAGEAGACKDPADLARYMALARLEHLAGDVMGKAGRGF